jgi:hypothetical protein
VYSSKPKRALVHRPEVNMFGLFFGLRLKKAGETFSPPLLTMRERKWALVLALTFLFVSELFLPVRGQAQSIGDSGFVFTGSHRPLPNA